MFVKVFWIPAYAGMTDEGGYRSSYSDLAQSPFLSALFGQRVNAVIAPTCRIFRFCI